MNLSSPPSPEPLKPGEVEPTSPPEIFGLKPKVSLPLLQDKSHEQG